MASTSSAPATQADTKRWKHFSSAIQLAIQRSAHRWTYENFCECFPLWTDESQHAAASLFNSISTFHETDLTSKVDEIFEDYRARDNINNLEAILQEAIARHEAGEIPKTAWKDHIDPKVIMAAHTVPILESTNQQLKTLVEELEAENEELVAELQAEIAAIEQLDAARKRRLEKLDQIKNAWQERPLEVLEMLNLDVMETHRSTDAM